MRSTFCKVKLKDILSVRRGTSLSGQYYSTKGNKIRLTLGNFNYPSGGFKDNTSKDNIFFIGPVKEEYILHKGDIITPLTEQVAGLLGETAKIPADNIYIQSGDIGLIIPKENKLYKGFAYYLISSKPIKYQLGAAAQQTKIRHTSPEKIENCIAWVPNDLNVQKNISDFLDALNNKIMLNNKINQELEQMAKTLYDYWFVQFDFPDEKGRPYKSANGKMIYNEVLKREIPEGWEVKNIFDVLDIQYGYPFNTELFTDNGGYSVVRIRDILTNSISAHTLEKADDKYKLHEGDLLIGMDGNFHMNYWNETGAYLNQRCVRIRCKEEQALSIIQAKYSLEPFIKKREQNISRTTVGHLSDKDFKSQYILAPKVNPNFHPKETFKSILCRITNNNNEIKNLVILRDFLLPLLINGQVSIQN